MSNMHAYLDDFGKIVLTMKRSFYNGRSDSFYVVADKGYMSELIISNVEEHADIVKYIMIAPSGLAAGVNYYVREQHGLSVPLEKRLIVRTKQFNERYEYDGDDLGAVYHKMHTDFALWAPTASSVILRVKYNGRVRAYPMDRTEKGVWRVSIIGNFKNATYVYLVERNGEIKETIDPYAYSSIGNGQESAVIDLEEVMDIPSVSLKDSVSSTDAIIYEASVRDMTAHPFTGTVQNSTFLALCEEGTKLRDMPTGLDYLTSLGVTHVQFLPVMDFATVDEYHPKKNYNWGYDPAQYLVPEGSYSSDPDDPYARMKELRKMVSAMHEHGMRVNLDVVFNHLYSSDNSPFEKTVPFYYFRCNDHAYLSNGSYCGNDFSSEQPMARRYIVHVIEELIRIYDIDGFRFDLMGILDYETMNAIRDAAIQMKPDIMIYGEGWNMPTMLPDSDKADIDNQAKMPHIGHFNDYFRDVVKGRTSDDQRYDKGFLTGDLGLSFSMLSALSANVLGTPYFKRFQTPDQSINALETHDNNTVWDKMHFCCGNEDRGIRWKRHKMMIATTFVAQGIPFLHAGIEYCGTKNDNGNSYNAGDNINQMDWIRAEYNRDMIAYTKKCISLRKKYKAFRFRTPEEIMSNVKLSVSDGGVIFYDIHYDDPITDTTMIRVLINPSFDDKYYTFEPEWRIIFDCDGNEHSEPNGNVCLQQLSVIVLRK